MKPGTPRSFSSAGKIPKTALSIVAGLAAALVATIAIVGKASAPDQHQVATSAARRVLAAASAWQSDNRGGCPTISTLVEDGKLDREARVDDAWGNRFRVVCTGDTTAVRSAGPDELLGTSDDISVEQGG